MSVKSTLMLVLSLATVALCASAPTEPNHVAPEPRFEMSDLNLRWTVSTTIDGKSILYDDPGSLRPAFAARIIVPRDREIETGRAAQAMVMHSPLSQKLSQAQKDFLAQGFGAWVDTSPDNVPNHYSMTLYAVSEEDAKLMAWALIDHFAINAQRSGIFEQRNLDKYTQRLEENERTLPEKEKQFEEVQRQCQTVKDEIYPLNDDREAAQLARELIQQMDKEAKTIDIDLAGVRGRLKMIDQYLAKPLSESLRERLEGTRIEQMVDLAGLEARQQAIQQVRGQQQRFFTLVRQRDDLDISIMQLKEDIRQDQERVNAAKHRLEHPWGDMLPLAVYQDKVILCHVQAKDSQN